MQQALGPSALVWPGFLVENATRAGASTVNHRPRAGVRMWSGIHDGQLRVLNLSRNRSLRSYPPGQG